MATVNVTLRIKKKLFESSPVWTTWEQMQITRIEFHISDLAGEKLTKVDVPISSTSMSSEFISTSVMLEQSTDYVVRAIAFSPFHPNGVVAVRDVSFDTADAATYYNFETTVINKTTNEVIAGATITFDVAGLNIVRTSRHDGLVWIQRIPAGTYTVTAAAAGFTTLNTTWNATGFGLQFLTLVPL